jgi:hypothetical protein
VRIVTSGSTNRKMTVALRNTGRRNCSLTFTACPAACRLWRSK